MLYTMKCHSVPTFLYGWIEKALTTLRAPFILTHTGMSELLCNKKENKEKRDILGSLEVASPVYLLAMND